MRIHGTTQRAKKAMRLGKATGFSSPEYMPFGAVFRIFCKRDFCVEVRDFKIPGARGREQPPPQAA